MAQLDSSRVRLILQLESPLPDIKARKLNLKPKLIPSYKVPIELERTMNTLYSYGYIAAESTLKSSDSNEVVYSITAGEQYGWKHLSPGNVDEGILSKVGYRDKIYRDRPMSYSEIQKLFKRLVNYYENHGHPFASIKLDSLAIKNNQISAVLHLEKNKTIEIDTIKIYGDGKVSRQYIENYIGIRQNDEYDEELINEISTRLSELSFVSEYRHSEVQFESEKTSLSLYVNHKKANNFNGIVGFLPDENTGELLITGDVKLNLKNAFGTGEEIDVNWKKLQTQTQDLKARLQLPFLFNLPIGADGALNIYRRDTTFTNIIINLGLQFILRGGDYVKVFFENDQNNLISTYGLDIIKTLPEYGDIRTNSYGIGTKLIDLDYRLNPRKGFYTEGDVSFGIKEIRQNARVNPEVYDSLNLKSNRYKGKIDGGYFFPMSKRQTVLFGFKGGLIVNENLFRNELFRIGGLKTFRGFDEESIFVSSYSIFTFEYRYLLEKNSYFSLFFDQGWYENRAAPVLITDTPFGFGTGISFDTKIGIFSLSYAIGKQFNNPIQIRAAKIHFGFVNYF